MTTLPDLAGRIEMHELGVTIDTHLPFNEWRDLVRQVLATTDRSLWTLGDLWLYGQEHYGRDYHAGLRELEAESRLMQIGARIARGYAPPRRRGQLSFELHAVVAGQEAAEQDRWLDEAERHGWNREQLAFAFAETIEHAPIAALSARVTGSLRELLLQEASRRDMDPKIAHDIALERGLRAMAKETVGEVAA